MLFERTRIDSRQPDNTVAALTTVTGDAQTCSVGCPADISQAADAGQCVAVVSYSVPTGSGGNCADGKRLDGEVRVQIGGRQTAAA